MFLNSYELDFSFVRPFPNLDEALLFKLKERVMNFSVRVIERLGLGFKFNYNFSFCGK